MRKIIVVLLLIALVTKVSAQNTTDSLGVRNTGFRETIRTPWIVTFDKERQGPEKPVVFASLTDWSNHEDKRIRRYSGTAVYTNHFDIMKKKRSDCFYIEIEEVYDLAFVKINGKNCGMLWREPFRLNITGAVRLGKNKVEIIVVNTWINRTPAGEQDTPAPSGIMGEVSIGTGACPETDGEVPDKVN